MYQNSSFSAAFANGQQLNVDKPKTIVSSVKSYLTHQRVIVGHCNAQTLDTVYVCLSIDTIDIGCYFVGDTFQLIVPQSPLIDPISYESALLIDVESDDPQKVYFKYSCGSGDTKGSFTILQNGRFTDLVYVKNSH